MSSVHNISFIKNIPTENTTQILQKNSHKLHQIQSHKNNLKVKQL